MMLCFVVSFVHISQSQASHRKKRVSKITHWEVYGSCTPQCYSSVDFVDESENANQKKHNINCHNIMSQKSTGGQAAAAAATAARACWLR
jgi:hypothetical protein